MTFPQGKVDICRYDFMLMTDYSNAPDVKVEKPGDAPFVLIPARDRTPVIELEFPEFQTLCPVSERPDAGHLTIAYLPDESIIESKSLRDYLLAWRNCATWQEYAVEEIKKALVRACKPEWLVVEIEWASRGGIYATVTSEYEKE